MAVLTFQETLAYFRERQIVLPDEYYGSLEPHYRAIASSASGLHTLDQVRLLRDSLQEALDEGLSFDQWKERVQDNIPLNSHRLETIYRTNLALAYARGAWSNFLENESRRPFLMYSAILDARVRPSHARMDGHIARVGDPVWQRWSPPCGFNCRCTLISLSPSQAEEMRSLDEQRLRRNTELARQRAVAIAEGPGGSWVAGAPQSAHLAALRRRSDDPAPTPAAGGLLARIRTALNRSDP